MTDPSPESLAVRVALLDEITCRMEAGGEGAADECIALIDAYVAERTEYARQMLTALNERNKAVRTAADAMAAAFCRRERARFRMASGDLSAADEYVAADKDVPLKIAAYRALSPAGEGG